MWALIAFALRDNGLIRTSQNTPLVQGESPLQRHMGVGGGGWEKTRFQFKLVLNVMHDHNRAHLTCTEQNLPEAGPNSSKEPSYQNTRSLLWSPKKKAAYGEIHSLTEKQKILYRSYSGIKFPIFCEFMWYPDVCLSLQNQVTLVLQYKQHTQQCNSKITGTNSNKAMSV